MTDPSERAVAIALATGFLAGRWTRGGLVSSGHYVLRRRTDWVPALADAVLAVYPAPPTDRPRELAAVVLGHLEKARADQTEAQLEQTILAGQEPQAWRAEVPTSGTGPALSHPVTPVLRLRNPWHQPPLDDVSALADCLGLTAGELAWFADNGQWSRRTTTDRLLHYRVSSRVSASGGVRVLEAPRPRLRHLQRVLLRTVLGPVPPHDAAHGFRQGRSVGSFAAPHAGQAVVIRFDLEGFFASVTAGRVHATLRSAGLTEPVAYALTGLFTTVTPAVSWRGIPRPTDPLMHAAHWRLGRRLAVPHLPQGAPTSPALANLAAYRLDVRISALVRAWGGRYTRYADDLALSGGRAWGRGTSRLLDAMEEIVRDEGFVVHPSKTAVLPRAGRQVLGGLVVNDRPHVSRAEVDRLRAVLHNCARYGPSTQNRTSVPDLRAHLAGRISWVAQHDPARGARLLTALDAVDWT